MDGRSYNAYLLSRNGRHIVFGGDTSYHEYFAGLASRKITVDLAMMPIGCYDPWIRNHANPEQAIDMANQMGAAYILSDALGNVHSKRRTGPRAHHPAAPCGRFAAAEDRSRIRR